MSPTLLTILVILIGIMVGGAVILMGLTRVMASGDKMQERMQIYAAVPDLAPRRDDKRRRAWLIRLRLRINTTLSAVASDEMTLQLMSANWPITVTEFTLIRIGVTALSFILGWLISGSPISGVALAVIAYMIPGVLLRRSINKRRSAFEKQLVDVLVLITGAVRAGFSLLQAIEVVEKEMNAPASEEFGRVRREVSLGLPFSQALGNLSARMENADLNMVITAININYQVGGNLTTMLSSVTETIRDRVRLFSEVRVLTTQQRYTGYLLSLLPFFIAALLFFLNPGYIQQLFQPGMICVPIGAIIGIVLGHFALQRLARIEV